MWVIVSRVTITNMWRLHSLLNLLVQIAEKAAQQEEVTEDVDDDDATTTSGSKETSFLNKFTSRMKETRDVGSTKWKPQPQPSAEPDEPVKVSQDCQHYRYLANMIQE